MGDTKLPSKTEIEKALEDILATAAFKRAQRMTALLRFLVEQTLVGKGLELKEYVIATQALGRSEDFDPREHRDVAIEVGRLRRYLVEYYSSVDGLKNPVRIEIPKFTYEPLFATNRDTDAQHRIEACMELFCGDALSLSKNSDSQIVVIVQADEVDKLIKEVAVRSELIVGTRFFKARSIVNRWDMDGAHALQKAIHSVGLPLPKILLQDRGNKTQIPYSVQSVISTGLGFTGRTTLAIKKCREWMSNKTYEDCGDAIALHELLVPKTESANSRFEPSKDGFRRLLPSDWEQDNYIDSYLEMREDANISPVNAYAIIFRYTEKTGDLRQVLWVLAGFTEHGTAIAGHYLAANWYELWKEHVRDSHPASLGDFLVVIEGPSSPDPDWLSDHWSEVLTVTPQKLSELGIACAWQKRMVAADPSPH